MSPQYLSIRDLCGVESHMCISTGVRDPTWKANCQLKHICYWLLNLPDFENGCSGQFVFRELDTSHKA